MKVTVYILSRIAMTPNIVAFGYSEGELNTKIKKMHNDWRGMQPKSTPRNKLTLDYYMLCFKKSKTTWEDIE